jgi:hypothetical protein
MYPEDVPGSLLPYTVMTKKGFEQQALWETLIDLRFNHHLVFAPSSVPAFPAKGCEVFCLAERSHLKVTS